MDNQQLLSSTNLTPTGIPLNDKLRANFTQTLRSPALAQAKAAAAAQAEKLEAKHRQEAADLQSARDQIAAIGAHQKAAANALASDDYQANLKTVNNSANPFTAAWNKFTGK